MRLTPENKFKKLIVIGDRLLIKPLKSDQKTASKVIPPSGVQEKEKVQQGYVIKSGPGYAIPMPVENEPLENRRRAGKIYPPRAQRRDLAIFLLSGATEVMYENEKYFIVPQSAILMRREEDI